MKNFQADLDECVDCNKWQRLMRWLNRNFRRERKRKIKEYHEKHDTEYYKKLDRK